MTRTLAFHRMWLNFFVIPSEAARRVAPSRGVFLSTHLQIRSHFASPRSAPVEMTGVWKHTRAPGRPLLEARHGR